MQPSVLTLLQQSEEFSDKSNVNSSMVTRLRIGLTRQSLTTASAAAGAEHQLTRRAHVRYKVRIKPIARAYMSRSILLTPRQRYTSCGKLEVTVSPLTYVPRPCRLMLIL
jgi:hypothetical protein